jgi:hypothetical protein
VSTHARRSGDRKLAEARALLDAGDARAAVKPLDAARKDFVAAGDLDRLQDLRLTIEDGYRAAGEGDEPAYERLLYASGQNIRFLSRRRAAAEGVPWQDPHPELDAPGRPEIRIERGVRRREIPWIVIGLTAGIALVVGFVLLLFVSTSGEHDRSIANDSPDTVLVALCDSPCEEVARARMLLPGASATFSTNYDLFAVSTPSGRRIGCVDASRRASVSDAGDC